MNLTISGHHLEVTPALRSYVTNKLDRVTRHFDQVVDVKVLLSVENKQEKDKMSAAILDLEQRVRQLSTEMEQTAIQVRNLEKQATK